MLPPIDGSLAPTVFAFESSMLRVRPDEASPPKIQATDGSFGLDTENLLQEEQESTVSDS